MTGLNGPVQALTGGKVMGKSQLAGNVSDHCITTTSLF